MKIVLANFGREHLGLEYLSAVLKSEGHDVALVNDPGLFSREDNVFYSPFMENIFRKKDFVQQIIDLKPDLVGFSPYTTTYSWAVNLANEIKKKISVPIAFGGIHTTLLPDEVIKNSSVDYVIVGEGEYVISELVAYLEGKRSIDEVGSLWFRRDGNVIRNKLRSPVDNLDKLPFPDKELFEDYVRYEDDYMIMTSRGCPFSCSYCCESYVNDLYDKKHLRRRSIENVMSELTTMKLKYNYREVMFFDSILFTSKLWVKDFMSAYKREIDVPFRCTGHVSCFDYEVAKSMKDAGCYCIDFGVQSFNEDVRKQVLNRFESNEKIKEALNNCDKVGIRYDVDLMFGLPGMTFEDYFMPIDFLKKSKHLNRLKCYFLSYFPRTAIVDKAKELNLLTDEDIKDINQGKIGDWFHEDSIKDKEHKEWKECFSKIYKIYPLMPNYLKGMITQRTYKLFKIMPGFFVILMQLVIGIRMRDHRFKIYIKNYFYSFLKIVSGRL